MKPKQTQHLVGLLLLLGLLLFTFFYQLSLQPVYVWDEARRANDSLQILLRGEWIIDFYDDDPTTWSSKSPILLWLQAASLYLFGIHEWALRFPSAAASVLIGICIWWFCIKYFKSSWLGVIAGSVFASTLAWVIYHAGRTGDYDALLTLFTTLYAFCFFAFCISQNNKWLKWFWVFLTMAVMVKGVAGLFFTPGLAIFALTQKSFKSLLTNKWFYIGAAFLLLVVSSYYVYRELHAPGFLQAMYNNELGGRYLNELEENGQPAFYYFKNFFWRYPYWIYLVVPAFAMGFFYSSKAFRKISLFNFILVASFILIISSAETKLFWYDLPVYPLLSIQVACLLYTCWRFLAQYLYRYSAVVQTTMASTLFIAVFFLPFRTIYKYNTKSSLISDDREQAFYLQQALKENRNLSNTTFLFDGYDRHIRYYIKRMQLKDKSVNLVNQADAVRPGQWVVASQPAVKMQLEEKYELLKKEEKNGCTLYYIKKAKVTGAQTLHSSAFKNNKQ